jgi:hypothetical protein
MLKYFLAAGALVVAGVPAAVGLSGNASFDRDVPVRVPEQAQTVAPSPAPTGSVDDDGTPDQGPGDVGTAEPEPGDDHGRLTPRDDRTEAGDDRDDRDGHHGRHHDGADDGEDDRSGSNSGSDDGGSNSGSDDGGHHGGGSDDGSGHD